MKTQLVVSERRAGPAADGDRSLEPTTQDHQTPFSTFDREVIGHAIGFRCASVAVQRENRGQSKMPLTANPHSYLSSDNGESTHNSKMFLWMKSRWANVPSLDSDLKCLSGVN